MSGDELIAALQALSVEERKLPVVMEVNAFDGRLGSVSVSNAAAWWHAANRLEPVITLLE